MASPFANVHPSLREPAFAGHDAPCRAEAEVFDCFVEGEIPPQINGETYNFPETSIGSCHWSTGTFYRVAPDPQVIPKYAGEVNFNADGMISAARFRNGHVDFKSEITIHFLPWV